MGRPKLHPTTIMVSQDMKEEWQKRAQRFEVPLAQFIRGKITHYYQQRLKAGEARTPWDEKRSYTPRGERGLAHRGENLQVRLDLSVHEKISQWAYEEGQKVGPFIASIMFAIDDDASAKPFFKGPPPSRAGKPAVKQTEILVEVGRRQFTEADAHTVFVDNRDWKRIVEAARAHNMTPSELLMHCFLKTCHPFIRSEGLRPRPHQNDARGQGKIERDRQVIAKASTGAPLDGHERNRLAEIEEWNAANPVEPVELVDAA